MTAFRSFQGGVQGNSITHKSDLVLGKAMLSQEELRGFRALDLKRTVALKAMGQAQVMEDGAKIKQFLLVFQAISLTEKLPKQVHSHAMVIEK